MCHIVLCHIVVCCVLLSSAPSLLLRCLFCTANFCTPLVLIPFPLIVSISVPVPVPQPICLLTLSRYFFSYLSCPRSNSFLTYFPAVVPDCINPSLASPILISRVVSYFSHHTVATSICFISADWCADSNLSAPIAVRSFRTSWDDSCGQTHLNLGN